MDARFVRARAFKMAWPASWRHRGLVAVVGGAGFSLGAIATMKSFLEASLINAASSAGPGMSTGFWDLPVDVTSVVDDTWVGDLASWLLTTLTSGGDVEPLVAVLLVYLGLTIAGAAVTVGTAAARALITQHAFVRILDQASDAAAEGGLTEDSWADQPGGMAGALQSNARSMAGVAALLVEVTQYLFALGAISIALLGVDPLFALTFIGVPALLTLVTVVQGSALAQRRKEFDVERAQVYARTTEIIDNKEVLLVHERKEHFLGLLKENALALSILDRRLATTESGFSVLSSALVDAGRIGVLALVAYFALQGAQVDNLGDGYFYVALFLRIVSPVRGILRGFDELFRSTAMSSVLLTLLDGRAVSPRKHGQTPAFQDAGTGPAIELDRVTFGYGSKPVLVDISFTVPHGGLTLVVGPSGVGKTTIARMILGFHEPSDGQVRVCGVNVHEWDRTQLLMRCSYGAQTKHVLHDTVRENLFGEQVDVSDRSAVDAQTERMARVLRQVGLDHVDLDSQATELSEGQRQRLALARVLLDTSEIVVLDEPLSGVDVLTFADVRKELEDWLPKAGSPRTVLLISHRLAFAHLAQHVVVLDSNGSVREAGPPETLRQIEGGLFARMWTASEVGNGA